MKIEKDSLEGICQMLESKNISDIKFAIDIIRGNSFRYKDKDSLKKLCRILICKTHPTLKIICENKFNNYRWKYSTYKEEVKKDLDEHFEYLNLCEQISNKIIKKCSINLYHVLDDNLLARTIFGIISINNEKK